MDAAAGPRSANISAALSRIAAVTSSRPVGADSCTESRLALCVVTCLLLHRSQTTTDLDRKEKGGFLQGLLVAGYQQPPEGARFRAPTCFPGSSRNLAREKVRSRGKAGALSVRDDHRYVIIGAGAIGGTVGGVLARAGIPTVLIARGRHAEVLAADGLTLKTP